MCIRDRFDIGRFLGDHRKEDLQIEGDGQPSVGPCPGANEHEVIIKKRVAKADGLNVTPSPHSNKAGHEGHGLSNRRGSWLVRPMIEVVAVSYTHLRAHETVLDLVC